MCVYHTLARAFYSSTIIHIVCITYCSLLAWFSITVIVCGCALKQTLNLIILFFGANGAKEERDLFVECEKV